MFSTARKTKVFQSCHLRSINLNVWDHSPRSYFDLPGCNGQEWVNSYWSRVHKFSPMNATPDGQVCVLLGHLFYLDLEVQTVKTLPAMWKTRVWSLGQKHPLEKEIATHSSILALRIPWTEELGRLQFKGSPRVRHDWATNTVAISIYYFCTVFDRLGKGKESSKLVINSSFT